MQKHNKRSLILGACFVVLFVSVQTAVSTTGRIDEFRQTVRSDVMVPTLPRYVANVTYSDLLATPHPNEFYSWAKDNEAWTAEFLATLRESGQEAEAIERWVGDPILVVLITDFEGLEYYTATFSIETGEVKAECEDTKTELWASLEFVQNFLVFADQNPVNETVEYAVDHYYVDWAVWSEQGFFDLLVTREALATLAVWGGVVASGYFVYRTKKRK